MKRFLPAMILFLLAGQGLAMIAPYAPDEWVDWSPAIVVGEVVQNTTAESREVVFARKKNWLFPHDEARIAIFEVLKNTTGFSIAAGDTISLFYATSNSAPDPEDPNRGIWVEDTEMHPLNAGDRGAFSLRVFNDEFRSGNHYQYRSEKYLPKIREAVQKALDENAAAEISE